jgi:hypothetical protein
MRPCLSIPTERARASIWTFLSHRQLVLALWLLTAYLLILYAALRWGHPSRNRYLGSD